jgi:hypothetical protein
MTFPSSWVVGAIALETGADITVSGTPVTVPPGTYYLRDADPAKSLIDEVLAAVTPEMTTPSIFIGRDRLIRVTAGASFTWTAIDPRLQAALGFASIPSTTSATATDVSAHLWSPAYCATTTGHPAGVTGYEQPTRAHTASLSGLTQSTTVHGTSRILTDLSWSAVLRARAWTVGEQDGAPGDYRRFWREVLLPGRRWKLYETVAESGTTDATPAVFPDALGPYKTPKLAIGQWDRTVRNFDGLADISLDGLVASELP